MRPRTVRRRGSFRASYAALIVVCGIACRLGAAPTEDSGERPAPELLAPKAFRAVVAKVMPSVVTIETAGGMMDRTRLQPPGAGRGRRRRGTRIGGIGRPGEGPSTGLIVSADGLVVTSTFNFLRRPPVVTVVLADGTRHAASMLGRDSTRKICLLRIEGARELPVPEFVRREDLVVGQWAIAAGVGFGAEEPVISAGIVSALSRISGRAVQTDANMSPANYGGPLLDIDGRVMGICVPLSPRVRNEGGGVEWYDSGIGFAIPIAGNEELLAVLRKGNNIEPAHLGIVAGRAEKAKGVPVAWVAAGSAAEEAGIHKGDIIVAVDGKPVTDQPGLRAVLDRHVAGDEVAVSLKRDKQDLTVTAVLADVKDTLTLPSRRTDSSEHDGPEQPQE